MFFVNHIAIPLTIYLVANGMLFGWKNWRSLILMCSAFLIDIDHLIANPIFDANRCSIGYHPLHQPISIGMLIFIPALLRLWPLTIGVIVHFSLDFLNC